MLLGVCRSVVFRTVPSRFLCLIAMEVKRQPLREINGDQGVTIKKPRIFGPTPVLKFAKITENAKKPTRGSDLAAGFDLYSAYDYTVPARGKVLAKTDIQIALPDGCYGRVAPRSGLAHKHFIDVGAGVIDQDYRGNVGVILFNFSDKDFEIKKGDRIAQLICERIFIPSLQEVQKLDDTMRGQGGFGSTGIYWYRIRWRRVKDVCHISEYSVVEGSGSSGN